MNVINLNQKLGQFHDHWNPRIIGELNGQQVKLAKLKGEFIWHNHQDEDELFLILKGTLKMEFRDRTEFIKAGEIIIVPRGVDHRPIAEEEVELMLFEPATTLNTGDQQNERTRSKLEKI